MPFSAKTAKKYLGQNFLIDDAVRKRIVAACGLRPSDTVLEIGPGRGAITHDLLKGASTVYAIEKDAALIRHLKDNISDPSFHPIEADFLTHDLSALPTIHKVIGNIPYNISTPIIEKLIRHRSLCADAFLTVQREFAQRLAAAANTKDYGALTCFVQYYADIKILFKISPQSFRPIPRVTSCFIHLHFRQPNEKADDEALLFKITQTAFQQRRKKIINALSPIMEKERLKSVLENLNIARGRRAENIPLSDYINLANTLSKIMTGPCPSRKTSV